MGKNNKSTLIFEITIFTVTHKGSTIVFHKNGKTCSCSSGEIPRVSLVAIVTLQIL